MFASSALFGIKAEKFGQTDKYGGALMKAVCDCEEPRDQKEMESDVSGGPFSGKVSLRSLVCADSLPSTPRPVSHFEKV